MELQTALRQILIENGIDFINTSNAIELLDKKDAFKKYNSLKFVFTIILSEGYIDKMIKDLKSGTSIVVENYITDVYDNCGVRKDVAEYILKVLKNELESFDYSDCTKQIINVPSDSNKHINFKGWEINGILDDFCQKLIQTGAELLHKDLDLAIYNGEFAGNKNCEILVIGSKYTNLVWKVVVLFPECNDWYVLKSEYLKYKDLYSKKYCTPESFEYFKEPYYEGDGYEMSAVSSGNCVYDSYFIIETGSIVVRISDKGKVAVSYEDSINSELHFKEKEKQAEFDI